MLYAFLLRYATLEFDAFGQWYCLERECTGALDQIQEIHFDVSAKLLHMDVGDHD